MALSSYTLPQFRVKSILMLALFLLGGGLELSGQNLTWSLPTADNQTSKKLNFQSSPPSLGDLPEKPNAVGGYEGEGADLAHNAYYGEDGHLEFFIVDNQLYDGNGYPIEAGEYGSNGINTNNVLEHTPEDTTFSSDYDPYQALTQTEWTIVPVPGQCQKFFLFALSIKEHHVKLSMVKLDMAAQNPNYPNEGEGRIEGVYSPSPTLFEGRIQYDRYLGYMDGGVEYCDNFHLAASPELGNGERLLFMSSCDSVKTFKVTSNGLVDDLSSPSGYDDWNIANSLQGYSPDLAQESHRAEMELFEKSGGGYRLAMPMAFSHSGNNSSDHGIYIADIDGNGNLEERYFDAWDGNKIPKGLEFSDDGEILYTSFTRQGYDFSRPVQYLSDISNYSTGYHPSSEWEQLDNNVNPNVPNNDVQKLHLAHIEMGEDGRLYFAGSDGIYALHSPNNPATSGWSKPFNVQIPKAQQYPGQTNASDLRPLPDQIDGEDNSDIFSATCECCEGYKDYDFITHEQSSSTTWDPNSNPWNDQSTVRVDQELVIDADVSIEDMTFRFDEDAKVVVEQGAELELENTTFTAVDCECTMWEGVTVKGNITQPPWHEDQGSLEMREGSMIEFARMGARVGYVFTINNPLGPNYSYPYRTGGHVKAYNSSFKDNIRDVRLNPYSEKNRSYFKLTDFYTTSALINDKGKNPRVHLELKNVKQIEVEGCVFENRDPGAGDFGYPDSLGIGILSANSEFKVWEGCDWTPPGPIPKPDRCVDNSNVEVTSEFRNLTYGVHATSANALKNASIQYALFKKNWHGIFLAGMDAASVKGNDFDVARERVGFDPPYGIYLQNCSRFEVADNYLETEKGQGKEWGGYGIVVENSNAEPNDEDANMVYRNDVQTDLSGSNHGFKAGMLAQGRNDGPGGQGDSSGLQFRCNRFQQHPDDSKHDIWKSSGVLDEYQGSCTSSQPSDQYGTPVDNRFSSSNNLEHFFQKNGFQYDLSYRYRPWGSTPVLTKPREHDPFTDPDKCQNLVNHDYTEHCPHHPVDFGWDLDDWLDQIVFLRGKFDSLKQVEKDLIDGGNTDGLLELIAEESESDPETVHDQLLEDSPYLSDTVLKAVIESPLQEGDHLEDPLLQNSPLTREVFELFMENPEIPESVKDEVASSQGSSERPMFYQAISAISKEMKRYEDRFIRHLSHRDTSSATDSLIEYLAGSDSRRNKTLLIDAYSYRGEYEKARELTKDLIDASGEEPAPLYLQLKEKQTGMLQDNGHYGALVEDPDLRQDIEAIATADDVDDVDPVKRRKACSQARGLLNIPFGHVRTEHFPDLGSDKSRGEEREKTLEEEDPAFSVHPNPSRGRFTVEHELEDGRMEVYDMQGRMIHNEPIRQSGEQTLELKQEKEGLYLLRLVKDGKTRHHEKLILR